MTDRPIKSALNKTRGITAVTVAFFAITVLLGGCTEEKHKGDLPQLRARQKLRVIVRPEPFFFLPRSAHSAALDRTIAEGLAKELGLELALVVAKDYPDMVDKLLNGEGDVIAADMTVTESRKKRVAFSTPYQYVDEVLITASGDKMPEGVEGLNGKEVCVRRSSSYFETLTGLKKRIPNLVIREMQEDLDTDEIIDKVERGECFSTVTDSIFWEAMSPGYEGLGAPLTLVKARPVAVAVRRESRMLKQKVNEFLISRALTGHRQALYTDDLEGLKKRRVLRMITRNNAMTYYIYRGSLVGFEYELMKRFADEHKLRLEIVIPPSHEDLIAWLNEGRGDVVAAAMTITEERAEGAAFTTPYNHVEEVVVVRADNNEIIGPEDLSGKTVHVRKSSSFYRTLRELKDIVKGLKIAAVPEDLETEEILRGVEEGRWEITVSDSNLLELAQSYGRPLKKAFGLKKTQIGWAVRKENKVFLSALNSYIDRAYRGHFYNTLKRKYFKDRKTILRANGVDEFRSDVSGNISPYDGLARKYAEVYGLDWRLITAQMFQESSFNPKRVSWAGAVGLMQLMPGTARKLGVVDMKEPEYAISAGTRYLARLIRMFDPELPLEERIRFALASYNVGYNHVADARRLAARMGLNPDEWFGNVERAMLLLHKQKYYEKARYGYCRGYEPVGYVREIQSRYDAYVEHVPQ
jgi:membrane-bound lytic murein transglycosylase F